MKNLMEYKDFKDVAKYSADDGVFFEKIFGINDLITSSTKEQESEAT
ncbi:MAG TPA: hypothetical protein VIN08_05830 [Ohtaekwangia sp.]